LAEHVLSLPMFPYALTEYRESIDLMLTILNDFKG